MADCARPSIYRNAVVGPEHAVIILFGWWLFRHGARKLWPYKFRSKRKAVPVPGIDEAPSLLLATVKGLSGYIALMAAALGFFVLRSCATSWHGIISVLALGNNHQLQILRFLSGIFAKARLGSH